MNMGSSPRTAGHSYEAIQNLTWSSAEKAVARKAFDRALHRELEAVISETKKRADKIKQPSELWDLERYLTQRRIQIDRHFDYRYSVLIFLFGDLIRRGKLPEEELQGLSEDKLESIRHYAELDLREARNENIFQPRFFNGINA
jgi:hypothetical protein